MLLLFHCRVKGIVMSLRIIIVRKNSGNCLVLLLYDMLAKRVKYGLEIWSFIWIVVETSVHEVFNLLWTVCRWTRKLFSLQYLLSGFRVGKGTVRNFSSCEKLIQT